MKPPASRNTVEGRIRGVSPQAMAEVSLLRLITEFIRDQKSMTIYSICLAFPLDLLYTELQKSGIVCTVDDPLL